MSELRSVVDVLRSEVLANLPDARLEEDFAELQRSCEQLEVERLRRLAEIERRATFKRDGHLSAASWLASQFKVGWGTARESVRTARALEEMPETRKALEEGDVSMSGAKVLLAARDADPDPLDERPPADRRVLAPGGRTRAGPGQRREGQGAAEAARLCHLPWDGPA